jgi:hypothetical protein
MLNIFTIALCERENLEQQLCVLRELTIPWRWCIVTGYARPVKDTSWCKNIGAPDDNDNTIEFAEGAARFDKRIVAIAQTLEWGGKTQMVNAALDALDDHGEMPSVLMQLDADEFWAPWQIESIVSTFQKHGDIDVMRFRSRFWVGENRVAVGYDTYGNMPHDWFRAWRWNNSARFITHEPPVLSGCKTMAVPEALLCLGLHFEHRAYCSEERVLFKEKYYGYSDLVKNWKELNEKRGPVLVPAGVFGNRMPFLTVEA